MDQTSAYQLLSRFSYSPNKLGYCGLNTANSAFLNCLFRDSCDSIPSEVTHFKALYPYLRTISQVTNLDMFSYEVIEAYWLGNDLLKKFQPQHYSLLIQNLKEQNLPEFFIEEISSNLPKSFIPLHLFNILHIGVGKITGSVPTNLESINNCMIRWGQITHLNTPNRLPELVSGSPEPTNPTLTVQLQSLNIKSPHFRDGANEAKQYSLSSSPSTFFYDPLWLPDLKIGDTIIVHWNWPTKILTDNESTNLNYWTNKLISSL